MPVSEADDWWVFEGWMTDFEKSYPTDEEKARRFKVFQQELRRIENHNKDPKHSYWLGLNDYSDMSKEEFELEFLGTKAQNRRIYSESDSEEDRLYAAQKLGTKEDVVTLLPPEEPTKRQTRGDDVTPRMEPEPKKLKL